MAKFLDGRSMTCKFVISRDGKLTSSVSVVSRDADRDATRENTRKTSRLTRDAARETRCCRLAVSVFPPLKGEPRDETDTRYSVPRRVRIPPSRRLLRDADVT